jgi:hypothetical protein
MEEDVLQTVIGEVLQELKKNKATESRYYQSFV